MFCPKCGTEQGDDLKFCKSCGANLSAVRQVVTTREGIARNPWGMGNAWGEYWIRRQEEEARLKRERESRITPEVKRYTEIKAGVITGCVGLGLMIFLYVFMQGIISGGRVPFDAAQIISRLWIVGVIPLFVGAGLLINGVLVSKKLVELQNQKLQEAEPAKRLGSVKDSEDEFSPSANWYDTGSAKPSVTENTTRQLEKSK